MLMNTETKQTICKLFTHANTERINHSIVTDNSGEIENDFQQMYIAI